MTIAEQLIRAKTDFDTVYEAGKKTEHDAFWDSYLDVSKSLQCFAGAGWNVDNFKPNKDIVIGNGYGVFMYNTMKVDLTALLEALGVSLITKDAFNLQNMFYNCSLIRVPPIDIRGISTAGQSSGTFSSAANLVTIDKIITDEAKMYNNSMFQSDTKLANITFEGIIGNSINFQWCPLTKASIINIVEHLSSTATGQTCTFNKAAKEAAFTDDEWAELIADKTNWTFSLV